MWWHSRDPPMQSRRPYIPDHESPQMADWKGPNESSQEKCGQSGWGVVGWIQGVLLREVELSIGGYTYRLSMIYLWWLTDKGKWIPSRETRLEWLKCGWMSTGCSTTRGRIIRWWVYLQVVYDLFVMADWERSNESN